MELWLPLDSYEHQHRYKYTALYHALRDAIHAGTLVEGHVFLPRENSRANMTCRAALWHRSMTCCSRMVT